MMSYKGRYFRGNLGDLAIGGTIAALFMFALVMGIGGLASDNSLNIPVVNSLYTSFVSNQSTALTGNLYALNSQVLNNSQSIKGANNWVSSTVAAIGLVATFFGSLPNMLGAMINTIAMAISIGTGVNTGLAVLVAYMLIILIIGLVILSAFFIFPLLGPGR